MSLNQLTQTSEKKWLIAKTYDLEVDGEIKISNPNARHGDALTCVSPGKAEFIPLTVIPSLPTNYFNMNTVGLQTINGFLSYTAIPTNFHPNFVISSPTSLTCSNNGVYWVMKKITKSSSAVGGVKCLTRVNGTNQDYSTLALQQTTTQTAGSGLSCSFLMVLHAGDILSEIFTIYGASFETDTNRPSTNILFVKIG